MEERHERAAVGEPDGRLGSRVAAADDADAGGAAPLRLLRARRVEDADPLVGVDVGDRQPAVVGARGENDGAGAHLVPVLESDEVAVGAGLEPDRAVRRGGAGAELARLRDRPGRQLGAADAGREAEVVLDPPRRARLAAECAALDDERVEPLGGAVDRGTEPRRAASDDDEVDLLAWSELEPDAERPRHLARRRVAQLGAAGQPHERQLVVSGARRSARPPHVVGVARCRARSRAAGCGGRTRPSAAWRRTIAAR